MECDAGEDGAATLGEAGRRARVREALVAPLLAKGLRKQRRLSADEHAAFLAALERRLAYLDARALGTLAEVVERCALGAARNVWPDEVSIVNWAAALEPPPDVDSRLVRSYLGSAAGRRAWDEGPGVAVALREHLRRTGRPPQVYDWVLIRQAAVDRGAELARAEARIAAGRAHVGDAVALEERAALLARVRDLVFAAEAVA